MALLTRVSAGHVSVSNRKLAVYESYHPNFQISSHTALLTAEDVNIDRRSEALPAKLIPDTTIGSAIGIHEGAVMEYLLGLWSYRISFWLTVTTGALLLWQFLDAKGTAGHIFRWAGALTLSIFVVYMNTESVINQPRIVITNPWHMRMMAFHQNIGLVYF